MHLQPMAPPLRRAPAAPGPRIAAAALVAVFALTLAACSASPASSDVVSLRNPSASPDPGASPSASVDPQDAMQAYAKCMRDHGVDVQVSTTGGGAAVSGGTGGSGFSISVGGGGPVPSGAAAGAQAPQQAKGGNDGPPANLQAALDACKSLMPARAAEDPNATPDPKLVEQLLAFSKCMRDHGIDYPDPKFDGGAVTMSIGGPGSNVDPSSQAFQDAQKACGSDLPGGGPMTIGGKGPAPAAGASGTNP
jgi:hypothetical protein